MPSIRDRKVDALTVAIEETRRAEAAENRCNCTQNEETSDEKEEVCSRRESHGTAIAKKKRNDE